jgi:hypothetical protein
MSNSVAPFITLAMSVSHWSGAVTPNPSIEKDVQRLAPLDAPHVKRSALANGNV